MAIAEAIDNEALPLLSAGAPARCAGEQRLRGAAVHASTAASRTTSSTLRLRARCAGTRDRSMALLYQATDRQRRQRRFDSLRKATCVMY
ncbi:hypothetical protein DSL92_06170 [Billgrantia gudaonensis]|uniref:Uncharacterized protein n=1 Tax=Billgrantia gudaonensis TaxID=376427 RepID=A0A432JIQ7_9GAMM|nr:hypothetical protein DSL92_06170 [Halomonas gudaonensis]